MKTEYKIGDRLTERQKESDDRQWYKDWVDLCSGRGGDDNFLLTKDSVDRNRDININYDLYDGKINKDDFRYLYNPYGVENEQPVDFTHKDIVSKRVKTIEGLEMARPFGYRVTAVNEEATTRAEQEETERMREYVNAQIMNKIHAVAEENARQKMEQMQMRLQQAQASGASPEELQAMQQEMQQAQSQMQQEMEQQVEAMTPDEVKKYMRRERQDPAVVLATHILNYIKEKQDVDRKFKEAWRDMAIAPFCCVWVGEMNREPVMEVVDPRGFRYKASNNSSYIEDGMWASYERYMTPSEIAAEYGDELSDEDYESLTSTDTDAWGDAVWVDSEFQPAYDRRLHTSGIRVMHAEWKDVKKIKFLKYIDANGEEQETVVGSDYRFDRANGDIEVDERWIVTRYEGTRISDHIYVRMREVPNQWRDLTSLSDRDRCKLSYKGVDMRVSLVDRMKPYQMLYDIFMYRIEMLAAADKGKSIVLDNSVKPSNFTMEQFLYYLDTLKIGFVEKNTKEGNRAVPFNVGEVVKEIDRSMSSDIQKYQQMLEWIDMKCGESVGMMPQLLGQIQQNEAVNNAQGAVNNSVNTLEHYFYYFNIFKKNVLLGLIECAKSVFMKYQPKVLTYVLDDMDMEMVRPDYDLLDESSYGITLTNNTQYNSILEMVKSLCQPAMQNQAIDLSDVIKVMKADNLTDAQELLEVSEERKRRQVQEMQEQQNQANQQLEQMKQEYEMRMKEMDAQAKMEQIRLKGEYDLKIADMNLQRQAILALGFDTDKDRNNNRVPDVIDQLKLMLDQRKADQKDRELNLKERQQESSENDMAHKREMDEKKLEIERKKAQNTKK